MGVFQKLGEEIADLSELTVQTFTGDITSDLTSDTESILDWTKLLEEAKNAQGKITLVASTKMKFDGDADIYFNTSISEDLKQAHLGAWEASLKVREGLIQTFKDLLGIT